MKVRVRISYTILGLMILTLLTGLALAQEEEGSARIIDRGLTINSRTYSDQIRLLKDYFRAKGNDKVPWGYNYDKRTRQLVTDFQKIQGLKVTGLPDQATLDLINQDIKNIPLDIGLRYPSTEVKGDMIIINTSSNTLYLLKDGRVQEAYPVATGKSHSQTPQGKFTVIVKRVNPAWGGAGKYTPVAGGDPKNPLGKRWLGISIGGGGTYGVHGNSNPASIGTYASMGCVRMFNPDVEGLYDRIKLKTPIWIGTEDKLEDLGVKFQHQTFQRPAQPVQEEAAKIEEETPKIQESPIKVRLNNQELDLTNPIINQDGTTYYPFREILEAVGADVFWQEEARTVLGILDQEYVSFKIDSNQYENKDGLKSLAAGQRVFILEDRTYLPIRAMMEGLGFRVDWDQASLTINLEGPGGQEIGPGPFQEN